MKQVVLITQGSQAIQLIQHFFELGYTPDQFLIFTESSSKNKCFIDFISYYKIAINFNIDYRLIKNNALVISYANLHKINVTHNATFINFHPGLLPKYKGSLSTVYSMINNDNQVGGTWHYMTNKIDAGNILTQFTIDVKANDTAFSLNHKIFNKSVNYLDIVITKVLNNELGQAQSGSGNFYYNKFPDIRYLDSNLQKRISYFPPLYK